MNSIPKLALMGSIVAFSVGIGDAIALVENAFGQGTTPPEAAQPDNIPVQKPEEAIASDAQQWYARDQGVSQAEAARRLRIQREMGGLIEQLRTSHQTRLAGIVIDHKPNYRLRVRLTGTAPVPAESHALGGSELPVVFETGAKATLDALRTSIRNNQAALVGLYPTLAGVGIDESTSEIVVTVYAPAANAAEAAKAKFSQAQALLGQPARIEIANAYPALQDVRGGSRLVSSTNYLCTSAFVVKNTAGTTGVTTAGHCDDPETYYNPNGTSIPLTFVTGSQYLDACYRSPESVEI